MSGQVEIQQKSKCVRSAKIHIGIESEKTEQKKPCSRCKKIKLLDDFSPQKNGPMGKRSVCKLCLTRSRCADRATNVEEYRKKEAGWRAANPEMCARKRAKQRAKYAAIHGVRIKKIKLPRVKSDKERESDKRYREVNKEKIKETSRRYYLANREKLISDSKEWNLNNKDKTAETRANWNKINHEKLKTYRREWARKNSDKINAKRREDRKSNPGKGKETSRRWDAKNLTDDKARLSKNISRRIRASLKIKSKNGRGWESLVGYSIFELMRHIEKQFVNGMTWDNYGEWHIDHEIPISVFNFSKPEHPDFKKCWALKNLQPMWAIDNIRKKDKISKPFQPSLNFGGFYEGS